RTVVYGLQNIGKARDADTMQTLIAAWDRVRTDETFPNLDVAFRAMVLSLGSGLYSTRFQITRRLADLDETINLRRQTTTIGPVQREQLQVYFFELGNALRERFEVTRNPADIEESIASYDKIISDPNASVEPRYYSDFSTALISRYERTGQAADLEYGIQCA